MLRKIINIKPFKIFSNINITSKINFFILTFFTFLGTRIPFQESLVDAYEAETTNPLNQIIYIFLFFSSLYISLQIYKKISSIIKKEKFLTIFIFWCLLSFLWSDYPFISFKRSFQLFVSYLTIINAVILITKKDLIIILLIVSYIYVFVNYISGVFIPEAIDPDFKSWRGIEITKNLLGYHSIMVTVVAILVLEFDNKNILKFLGFLLLILSTGLVFLSYSTTNIIGIIAIFSILFFLKFQNVFGLIGIRKTFFNISIFFILILGIIISLYAKEVFSILPQIFGKDTSFTGRDLIWGYVWNEIKKRPLLGYGYGTYWIMGSHIIDLFVAYVGWKVNQAHNGFLEILLQLGAFGLFFFIIVLIKFSFEAFSQDSKIGLLIIIPIIIVNFSEGFIFSPRDVSTLIFILYYFTFVNEKLTKII